MPFDEDEPLVDLNDELRDIFDNDKKLDENIEKSKIKIKIIGVGGAGNNAIAHLQKHDVDEKYYSVMSIGTNTDFRHIKKMGIKNFLVLGTNKTRGRGAGADPEVGIDAAKERQADLEDLVSGTDLIIVIAGLGKGTGSGAGPVIANIAKSKGANVLSVCIMPFKEEGKDKIAQEALSRFLDYSDNVVVFENEEFLSTYLEMPYQQAMELADTKLAEIIHSLIQMFVKSGRIDADYSDFKKIIEMKGFAAFGVGESSSSHSQRTQEALKEALGRLYSNIDKNSASGVIVSIGSNDDLSMNETDMILAEIKKFTNDTVMIKKGEYVDNSLNGRIRITVLISGATYKNKGYRRDMGNIEEI
ncbi:cell division protein FtsZ [Caldiplasma sukawensis]